MLSVDKQLPARYRALLLRDGAPIAEHSAYLKWLGYYLDFCSKYHFPDRGTESLPPFLDKLEEKRQTKAQQEQAGRAIKLYYEMWSSGSVRIPGKREVRRTTADFPPRLSRSKQRSSLRQRRFDYRDRHSDLNCLNHLNQIDDLGHNRRNRRLKRLKWFTHISRLNDRKSLISSASGLSRRPQARPRLSTEPRRELHGWRCTRTWLMR